MLKGTNYSVSNNNLHNADS